jgi:hypothetical protein
VKAEFVETPGGHLSVWDWPVQSAKYVIGIDVASGKYKDIGAMRRTPALMSQLAKERPDYSCAIVIDQETAQHVASWHGYIEPTELASAVAALGVEYNGALLVPERNTYGAATIETLHRQIRYDNIYVDKNWNKVADVELWGTGLGWATTESSKPFLIQRVHEWLAAGPYTRDRDLVTELRTMQYDEQGRARAKGRDKDDRVIALGLALQGRYELMYGTTTHKDVKRTPYTIEERLWAKYRQKVKERERGMGTNGSGLGDRPRLGRWGH